MIDHDVSGFPCLVQIEMYHLSPFIAILKHLIMNITVRFRTISFFLNKRTIRPVLDYENMTFNSDGPVGDQTRCGLSELFLIFGIRFKDIPIELDRIFRTHGLQDEWVGFVDLITRLHNDVWRKSHEHEESLSSSEKNLRQLFETRVFPNLIDAFGVVERGAFPNLWRFVIRILTIMPTSVECEQSFSFLNNTKNQYD